MVVSNRCYSADYKTSPLLKKLPQKYRFTQPQNPRKRDNFWSIEGLKEKLGENTAGELIKVISDSARILSEHHY